MRGETIDEGVGEQNHVGDRAICAPSVKVHAQRLGYIRSRSYSLYRYVFDAGPNKHNTLLGLLITPAEISTYRSNQKFLLTSGDIRDYVVNTLINFTNF